MPDHDLCDMYNGARCKTYSWTQSLMDIEIRMVLGRQISYEEVVVEVTSTTVCVRLQTQSLTSSLSKLDQDSASLILIKGELEHPVIPSSLYWLIDNDKRSSIVLFLDKSNPLWWKRLLKDEKQLERGQREYAIAIEHLDDGSRMMINKLVIEQRNKMRRKHI